MGTVTTGRNERACIRGKKKKLKKTGSCRMGKKKPTTSTNSHDQRKIISTGENRLIFPENRGGEDRGKACLESASEQGGSRIKYLGIKNK